MTIAELAPRTSIAPILHEGVYGRTGGNFTLGQTEAAEVRATRTRYLNQADRLEKDCFNLKHPDVLLLARTNNVGDAREVVSGMVPASGRAHESIMIMAGDLNRRDPNDPDLIESQFIQDLDLNTQEVYWDLLLGGLYAQTDTKAEGEMPVITMNAYPTYSNNDHQLAQSIGLPHGFVSRHKRNEVRPFNSIGDMFGRHKEVNSKQGHALLKENRFLKHYPDKDALTTTVANAFQETDFKVSTLYRASKLPFGYEIQIGRDDRLTGAEMAEIMRIQHDVYTSRVVPMLSDQMPDEMKAKLYPQPACQYLITEGKTEDSHQPFLRIAVRPALLSAAGPLETAGQMTEIVDYNGAPDRNTQLARGMKTFQLVKGQGYLSDTTQTQLNMKLAS